METLSYNALVLRLERSLSLGELGAIRKMVPIQDCGEPLIEISRKAFSFEDPHPYQAVGAPYAGRSPYCVREGILHKLTTAQNTLREMLPGYRLHIFDAYRPLAVQIYMVNYTRDAVIKRMELDPDNLTYEQEKAAMQQVFKVWATPTSDPAQPPPHLTGSAVDLTIVDAAGNKLDMGSVFDEMSERILPNYYREDLSDYGRMVHRNRELLNTVMTSVGFFRVSHEWWHFSYGDQMWALLKHLVGLEPQSAAIYGAIE